MKQHFLQSLSAARMYAFFQGMRSSSRKYVCIVFKTCSIGMGILAADSDLKEHTTI